MLRAKGTQINTILPVKLRGTITRKASKTEVGRCKGMDRIALEGDVERATGPCVLENSCKSCCLIGLNT